MHNVSLTLFRIATPPFQALKEVGSFVAYLAAQAFAGFHIYIAHSLKGREITLLSKVIRKLETNQLDDRLLEELKTLIKDSSPTKPSKGICEESFKRELLTVLKTHRYSLCRLYKGTAANRALFSPIYRFVNHVQDSRVPQVDPFSQLDITEKHRQTIAELLTILASNGVSTLRGMRTELGERAEVLRDLHPLKFLAETFSDEGHRAMVREMKNDNLKWYGIPYLADGFVRKTAKKLAEFHEAKSLTPLIPGFCQALQIPEEKLASLVQNGEWEQFVETLVAHDYSPSAAK